MSLTLVDGSKVMLDAARRRVAAYKNIRYVQAAFDKLIRREIRIGPFDFVASSFAIHHLHLPEKAMLFQLLFEELQPGAWFLNIDTILPDQPVFTEWLKELWRAQIRELEKLFSPAESYLGVPDQAWSDPDNKFSTLQSQLNALTEAGFGEVECHYRNGFFAVYTGRKPQLRPPEVLSRV